MEKNIWGLGDLRNDFAVGNDFVWKELVLRGVKAVFYRDRE